MSNSNSKPLNNPHNIVDIRSDFHAVRMNIAALRESVVVAWRERGVMLTPEQQRILRDEIADTCQLLTALTKSSH